jgi:hypothetical protein
VPGLRARLHSPIVSEKPDVRCYDFAGINCVEQKSQEPNKFSIKFQQFFTGEASLEAWISVN